MEITLENHRLDAIEAGLEAASEAVSGLPAGQQSWNTKELLIATEAARAAVTYAMTPTCRQPEPPPGLAEFERDIMASDFAHLFDVDRSFARALLCYVRRLERDVENGSFW